MSKIRNLATGNLGDIAKQQHRDQYATPLNGSSVGSGGQRFYGTGKLSVENEGLYVKGVANISGTLNGSGTFNWTGDVNVTGPTKLGGNTTVSGKLDVTGAMATKSTLSVEGITTLKNDLRVVSGGKVTVGGMTLDPTAEGGSIIFSGGGGVQGQGGTYAAKGAGNAGFISNTTASVFAGASQVDVKNASIDLTSPRVNVSGNLWLSNILNITSAANMHVSATGAVYRSTSAARFKIDPQPMDLPDSLLEVPVKAWIDLGHAEAYAELYDAPHPRTELQSLIMDDLSMERVPGIVAEEVEAAGGHAFVTYGMDGSVEGVAYDRLALARTEILARQVKQLQEQLHAA